VKLTARQSFCVITTLLICGCSNTSTSNNRYTLDELRLLDHPRSKKNITNEDVGVIIGIIYPELYAAIKEDSMDWVQGTVMTVSDSTIYIVLPGGYKEIDFVNSEFIVFRGNKFIALVKGQSLSEKGIEAVILDSSDEVVMPGDKVQNRL
jgi:hypothetical protein